MTLGRIKLTVQDQVAEVVVDDIAKHNAMSLAMWEALRLAFEEIDGRSDIRVCLLRGAGKKHLFPELILVNSKSSVARRALSQNIITAFGVHSDRSGTAGYR